MDAATYPGSPPPKAASPSTPATGASPKHPTSSQSSTSPSRPAASGSPATSASSSNANNCSAIDDEQDVSLNVTRPTAPLSEDERTRIRQAVKSMGPNRFMREFAFIKKVSLFKLLLAFRDQFTEKDWASIESAILPNAQVPELYACLTIAVQRYYSKRTRLPDVTSLDDVVHLLRTSSRILLVTGAGISVSCGIPDFRSPNGIYARLTDYELTDPTDMFNLEYFKHKPETFYSFAKEIYPSNFKPSPSHMFVALLEHHGKLLRNYTQNIDNIEELAGVQRVVQCHGSFRTARCVTCGYSVPGSAIEADVFAERVPRCSQCPESADLPIMKPDIVFFGEQLPAHFFSTIDSDMAQTDFVLVIGSSLKVAPVSEILRAVPDHVPQVIINRELLPHLKHHFDVHLLGNADTVVADLCARLGWELEHERFDEERGKVGDGPEKVGENVYAYEGAVLDAKWESESSESESEDGEGEGEGQAAQTTQRLFDDDDDESDDDDEDAAPRPTRGARVASGSEGDDDAESDDAEGGISDDELAGLEADLAHEPVRVYESGSNDGDEDDEDDGISAEELAGLHADLLDDNELAASSLKRYRDEADEPESGASASTGRRVSKRSRQG